MRTVPVLLAVGFVAALFAGCDAMPRDQYIQWVARDAWNPECAEKALVETWKAENKRWKIKGEVMLVDVEATFKLGNDCGGMPAYESKRFEKQGLELSRCKADGKSGWAIPGMESKRCWTGPRLAPTPPPPTEG